jgi:CheY-like chemotaxis protein
VTGWGQDAHRRKSKEAGFDHHLTKPVEFDVLQAVLKQVTSRLPERRLAAR